MNPYAGPSTPSDLVSNRLGLCSYKTPFISPLQIVPSPLLRENNLFEHGQNNIFMHDFQLEEDVLPDVEQLASDSEERKFEDCRTKSEGDDIVVDETNMLDFILNYVTRQDKKIQKASQYLKDYGNTFTSQMFDYLTIKFRNMRKTKEQMVKYCVRKSFKQITNKMRSLNRDAYAEMENNQVVAEYFQIHCEGDTQISMPFKKNSQLKTMNAIFLKKIFQCRQYNLDYKQFLKQFPNDYNSDNQKKIKSMNQVIKKCIKTRTFKGIDQYKRLPWTAQLLDDVLNFANSLFLEYSPFKNQDLMCTAPQKKWNKTSQPIKKVAKKSEKRSEDQFEIIRADPSKKRRSQTPATPHQVFIDPLEFLEEEMII